VRWWAAARERQAVGTGVGASCQPNFQGRTRPSWCQQRRMHPEMGVADSPPGSSEPSFPLLFAGHSMQQQTPFIAARPWPPTTHPCSTCS
jgi:hypothetical protein